MNRVLSIAILSVALSGCVTELSVRRHSSVSMNNATADSILGDFSTAIYVADSGDDFACATDFGPDFDPALYLRDGGVATYAATGVINSQADFNAVIAQPGYVKVVSAINWCGSFLPNVIGCAPVPGNSLAVVRFTANQEGVLWAHEFGHTVGLSHRENTDAVMRSFIGATHRKITSSECVEFTEKYNPNWPDAARAGDDADRGIPAELLQMVEKATSPAPGVDIDGQIAHGVAPDTDVVTFVRRTYVHGTPMAAAARFENTGAVATLLGMLADPAEQPYWGNIAAVLGMIGDRSVAPALIHFAESHHAARTDGEGQRVVTAALMGLGYLANRTADASALEFLARAGNAAFWAGDRDSSRQLAKSALIALALSGHPQGRDAISSASRSELPEGLATALLQVNDEVASVGIAGYYAR